MAERGQEQAMPLWFKEKVQVLLWHLQNPDDSSLYVQVCFYNFASSFTMVPVEVCEFANTVVNMMSSFNFGWFAFVKG